MHRPTAQLSRFSAACVATLVLHLSGLSAQGSPATSPQLAIPGSAWRQLPDSFIANQGQWDPRAAHRSRKAGVTSWFTRGGWVLDLPGRAEGPRPVEPADMGESLRHAGSGSADQPPEPQVGTVVRMEFEHPDSIPVPRGEGELPGHYNFLIGEERNWQVEVPAHRGLRYRGVYRGVDVVVRSGRGIFKYDVELARTQDLPRVVIRCLGAERLSLEADGSLVAHTAMGRIVQAAPVTFQVLPSGLRQPVISRYRLLAGNRFGFEVDTVADHLPLVIDPDLDWSSYVGGNGDDQCLDVANLAGSPLVTVCGRAVSTDFPWNTGAYQRTNKGLDDAFVARFDPGQTGSAQLVWGTYLGGSGKDWAMALDVDLTGAVVVAGMTASTSAASPFPTLNAQQATPQGLWDAFVTRLGPNGLPTYSTYLGGTSYDWACGVVIDKGLVATVVGYAASSRNFPMKGALRTFLSGPRDVFITRIDSAGALTYSTYDGGSRAEGPNASVNILNEPAQNLRRLAVNLDHQGNVLVTGVSWSQNYPLVNPYDSSNSLCGNTIYSDVFVTRYQVNKSGPAESLVRTYSTYLGVGCRSELGTAIAADKRGVITVTGIAGSGFPIQPSTAAVVQGTPNGGDEAFVSWLDPSKAGSAQLVYSTYLGGSGQDAGYALTVDDCGTATVAGYATNGLYTTLGAYSRTATGQDAFVTRISPNGNGLGDVVYSTFLGGSSTEAVFGMAGDGSGGVYVAGGTQSTNHPTTPGSWQGTDLPSTDGWVAHLLVTNQGVVRHGAPSPQPCAGSLVLDAAGTPKRGNSHFAIQACGAEPGALGFLAISTALSPNPVMVGGAKIYILPQFLLMLGFSADVRGGARLPLPLPATLPQVSVALQAAYANSGCGVTASNALVLTVQ